MPIYDNICEFVGNTPIVKLKKLSKDVSPTILVKVEAFNPGGSIKDRIACNMIKTAIQQGKLKPGGTIVEPTSGNTGIGLALIGAARNFNVILTMPDTMSTERRSLLKAFGAQLVLTPGKQGMKGAIDKAEELVKQNKNYYMPQQFSNPANPDIHRQTTAREILNDTNGKIDYFVAGVGTGGTLTGIGETLKENNPKIKVIAVEPSNSAILSGEKPGPHNIQGIGAGFNPDIFNDKIIDQIIKVRDKNALETARKLAKQEGILAGISSGAAIAASLKLAQQLTKDKVIVTIAPDTGERYLSTELFTKE